MDESLVLLCNCEEWIGKYFAEVHTYSSELIGNSKYFRKTSQTKVIFYLCSPNHTRELLHDAIRMFLPTLKHAALKAQ